MKHQRIVVGRNAIKILLVAIIMFGSLRYFPQHSSGILLLILYYHFHLLILKIRPCVTSVPSTFRKAIRIFPGRPANPNYQVKTSPNLGTLNRCHQPYTMNSSPLTTIADNAIYIHPL